MSQISQFPGILEIYRSISTVLPGVFGGYETKGFCAWNSHLIVRTSWGGGSGSCYMFLANQRRPYSVEIRAHQSRLLIWKTCRVKTAFACHLHDIEYRICLHRPFCYFNYFANDTWISKLVSFPQLVLTIKWEFQAQKPFVSYPPKTPGVRVSGGFRVFFLGVFRVSGGILGF